MKSFFAVTLILISCLNLLFLPVSGSHLSAEPPGEIRLQIQGDDLPFRSRIPLYRHNGAFVRGLDPAPDTDEVEVRILLNGERVDLPLPGRFENEEGEIRYRFPVNN